MGGSIKKSILGLKLGEKVGIYKPTSKIKQAQSDALKKQKKDLLAAQTLKDEELERKKRNSLFQFDDSVQSVGGRTTLYGN